MARVRARGEDPGVKQETRPVPLSGPYLDEREEALVLEVLRSGRLSLGPTRCQLEIFVRMPLLWPSSPRYAPHGHERITTSSGLPSDETPSSP